MTGHDTRQARQRFAWREVRSWDTETARRVQGLPMQIRGQGLTTAMAVLLREDRRPPRRIVDALARWLLVETSLRVLPWEPEQGRTPTGRDLLDVLLRLGGDAHDSYLAAQADALGLSAELKLLASAVYGEEEVLRADD